MNTPSHSIVPLSCDDLDIGSQKCHVGPRLLQTLNARLNCPAKVKVNGQTQLCRLWPRMDESEQFLSIDTSVCRTVNTDKLSSGASTANGDDDIVIVDDVVTLDAVEVDIVIAESSRVYNVRRSSCLKERLRENLTSMLSSLVVAPGYTVACSEMPVGQLLGLTHVVVLNTQPDCECGELTPSTNIIIRTIKSSEHFKQRLNVCRLGGLNRQFRQLQEIFEQSFQHSEQLRDIGISPVKGVLLRGPAGCGKTSLVHAVTAHCDAFLISVTPSQIVGCRPGESEGNLEEVFANGTRMSLDCPVVIFFDDIDTLCTRPTRERSHQNHHVASHLARLMAELPASRSIVVVAATSRPGVMDPKLRGAGKLEKEIFLGIPNISQRKEIIDGLTENMNLAVDVDAVYLAEATPGFVGADLVSLCQEAFQAALRYSTDRQGIQLGMEHFHVALHAVIPSSQRHSDALVEQRPLSWDDIGGLEDVKLQLQQAIEWPLKHPQAFSRLGLPRPKGVLLYGPPGCAKTTLVRAAASACHVTFLSVSGAQLYSPFVGDSERKMTEVFEQARAGAPCILFIDEIDSVVGRRGTGQRGKGVQERVLSTLLNEMDGIGIRVEDLKRSSTNPQQKVAEGCADVASSEHCHQEVDNCDVLLVVATNRPDMLDDALLRPGRLDRIIYVPLPDEQSRLSILCVHTRQMPLEDVCLSDIAGRTDGFTGADLENLCREVALHALSVDGLDVTRVTQQHFIDTLVTLRPSITRQQLKQYAPLRRFHSVAPPAV